MPRSRRHALRPGGGCPRGGGRRRGRGLREVSRQRCQRSLRPQSPLEGLFVTAARRPVPEVPGDDLVAAVVAARGMGGQRGERHVPVQQVPRVGEAEARAKLVHHSDALAIEGALRGVGAVPGRRVHREDAPADLRAEHGRIARGAPRAGIHGVPLRGGGVLRRRRPPRMPRGCGGNEADHAVAPRDQRLQLGGLQANLFGDLR
mmetsp:Transcript_29228/g.84645  ORF Transcript_29228/g.84645 Transcript_29228/m.84645 type:complete len:204 (-) Transcript_29228:150-761(-)